MASEDTMALDTQNQSKACGSKKARRKYNAENFQKDGINHLTRILLGSPTPVDDVSGLCPSEWFGVEAIEKANQATRYKFYCLPAQRTEPKNIKVFYFYQTINANAILREVRRLLKDERWLSRANLMGPLKVKLDGEYLNPEEAYIETVISKAFDIEREKAFPYILYLHREHVQKKLESGIC